MNTSEIKDTDILCLLYLFDKIEKEKKKVNDQHIE